jgi:hypothetical protein
MGDFFAAVLWVLILACAVWFALWSMGPWTSLFLPDISWIPWPL